MWRTRSPTRESGNEMLERLNNVEWSRISHAYGPATDVPAQLRVLVANNAEAWKKAVWELHGNVWHQGTVYEASAHIVPFLLEIIRDGDLRDEQKAELLGLVALIGNGNSYVEVHGFSHTKTGGHSRRMTDSERHDQLQKERAWVHAAQVAVAEGVDLYIALLRSSHAPTRLLAAYLLGLSKAEATEMVETLLNNGVPLE